MHPELQHVEPLSLPDIKHYACMQSRRCLTNRSHDGGVQEHLLPTRLQSAPLHGRDQIPNVEVDHILKLVRRPIQLAC